MSEITGQTLIGWGLKPGKHFVEGIALANRMRGQGAADDAIAAADRELRARLLAEAKPGILSGTCTHMPEVA